MALETAELRALATTSAAARSVKARTSAASRTVLPRMRSSTTRTLEADMRT
jgi:hypothetical protein